MTSAISSLAEIMGEMDITNRTPLTVALAGDQCNDMFIYAVCKELAPKSRALVGETLKSECDNRDAERGSTCLHWAMHRAIDPELITIMTSFVPAAMFITSDDQGRTPLHVAVEYERCSAAQISIVNALLVRGRGALGMKLSDKNGRFNAYQYHEYTRREREIQKDRPEAEKSKTASSGTPLRSPNSVGLSSPASTDPARSSNVALQNARLDAGKSPLSPPSPPQQPSQNSPTEVDREVERATSSVKIRELLKLAYLRSRKPLDAVECLRVQSQPGK